jgi:hypothetical protein
MLGLSEGDAEGLTLSEGEILRDSDADGLTDGLSLGEIEALPVNFNTISSTHCATSVDKLIDGLILGEILGEIDGLIEGETLTDSLGLTEILGLIDGEMLGEIEGLILILGLKLGLIDILGEIDRDSEGETLGLIEAEGETDEDGDTLADAAE